MAQRLNKKLVVSLTITGMVITTGAAVVMLRSVLPKRDPAPMVEQAERARTAGDYATASRWYERAYVRARSAEGGLGQANEYLIEAGELALAAGDARQAVKLWQKVVTDDSTNERAQQNIVDYLLEAVSLRQALWSDVQKEAEKLLQTPVYLQLWVKVRPNWRRNQVYLRELGFAVKDQVCRSSAARWARSTPR